MTKFCCKGLVGQRKHFVLDVWWKKNKRKGTFLSKVPQQRKEQVLFHSFQAWHVCHSDMRNMRNKMSEEHWWKVLKIKTGTLVERY
jgi:hypothetical protein